MKQCFKCKVEKELSEFYKHKQMGDGHLNKCKECTKIDVDEHRSKNIEKIRAYDRERGHRQGYEYTKEYRERYPNKCRAHRLVSNAIKSKRLYKLPCEVCRTTEKIHAHHDDYAKPLNVRWLCSAHHSQWHAKNGEALNP